MSKLKVRSHFESLRDPIEIKIDRLPNEITELVPVSTLKNGVKVTVLESRVSKISDRDKGLKWYDFSLDSLAASGAIGGLNFVSLDGDRLGIADHMSTISIEVKDDDKNIE